MISTLFLVAALTATCPQTQIDNKTKTWTEGDQKSLNSASEGCKRYYPDSPCVKLFRKKADGDYNVICGAPKKLAD